MGGANTLLFSPAPPVWEDPSHLPLLISPASLLCPQRPTWPGGGLGGQGTGLGAQQAPSARVGGAITLHSSPAPPGRPLPPASPDFSGLPSMPPRTQTAWRGVWRAGNWTGSSAGSPMPEWVGQSPSAPLPLFPESPSRLPFLIFPASGAPILSGLHFSSHLCPPMTYRFTLGFLPSPWASVAGRCPSCGETLTLRLSYTALLTPT